MGDDEGSNRWPLVSCCTVQDSQTPWLTHDCPSFPLAYGAVSLCAGKLLARPPLSDVKAKRNGSPFSPV